MKAPQTIWTAARDLAAALILSAAAAMLLVAIAGSAHAESLPPPEPPPPGYYDPPPPYDPYPLSPRAAWAACRPDVQRYCPRVLPGGGRILSCLAGNKDRLSIACSDALRRIWAYYRR